MGYAPQGGGGGGGGVITLLKSGSVLADGTEQTIFDETMVDPTNISGWVNIDELDNDDILYVREYITFGGEEKVHALEEYRDAQSTSQCFFEERIIRGQYRVTIEQSATVMRTFKYEFYKG
jgi:hypothetical protein